MSSIIQTDIEAYREQYATPPESDQSWFASSASLTTAVDLVGARKLVLGETPKTHNDIKQAFNSIKNFGSSHATVVSGTERGNKIGGYILELLQSNDYSNKYFSDRFNQAAVSLYSPSTTVPEDFLSQLEEGPPRNQFLWLEHFFWRVFRNWQDRAEKPQVTQTKQFRVNIIPGDESSTKAGKIDALKLAVGDLSELVVIDTFYHVYYIYHLLLTESGYSIHSVENKRSNLWMAYAMAALLYRKNVVTPELVNSIRYSGSASNMANYIMNSEEIKSNYVAS